MLPVTFKPKSICILRLSALGDVTHAVPVLRALQQQWPTTEITWICGQLEYKLLSVFEGVRFIVFNKKDGMQAYWNVRKVLAGQRFDLLLHMQLAARANFLSMLIKADYRIGWDRASSKDLHHWFINHQIKPAKKRHQVQTFLEFARALSIEIKEPLWDWPMPEAAVNYANKHIDTSRKTLLISPCSSHALRNWPVNSIAQVADYAIQKLDMQVILSGGPSELEKSTGENIEKLMTSKGLNLIGQDTLVESMAMLKQVDVVMSPDSGPVHMANAVGTKVLGLYACTNPERSGPYNSVDNCVNKFPQAVEQFTDTTVDKIRWGKKVEQAGVMELILVDEVCEILERIVNN